MFATSPRLDFLTHLLRDETFDHGIYGNRPDRSDTITTMEEFGTIRDAMFQRYRGLGIKRIMELERSASTLYAWSQAGGREELVAIMREHVEDDDAKLLRAMLALAGRSRQDGRPGSLDPSGLACLFDNVPSLLEHVLALAASGNADAKAVLRSVGSSLSFRGGSIQGWIEHQRGTGEEGQGEDGGQ